MKQKPAHAPTCPTRVDEERPQPRRLEARIDVRVVAVVLELVAAVQRLAPAPATGGDDLAVHVGDVVRAVGDELTVRSEEKAQRAVDLLPGVERLAQSSNR